MSNAELIAEARRIAGPALFPYGGNPILHNLLHCLADALESAGATR